MRTMCILLVATLIAQYSNGQSPGVDSLCHFKQDSLKVTTQEWLLEVGYIKNDQLIFTNVHSFPRIYKKRTNGLVNNTDTAYEFIADPKRFFASNNCQYTKTVNYFYEFLPMLADKSNSIDSISIKGHRRKMKKNFGTANVCFLYLSFVARITYFEDYKNEQIQNYYYDFDKRSTTRLIEGNYPNRYIIEITIL